MTALAEHARRVADAHRSMHSAASDEAFRVIAERAAEQARADAAAQSPSAPS